MNGAGPDRRGIRTDWQPDAAGCGNVAAADRADPAGSFPASPAPVRGEDSP